MDKFSDPYATGTVALTLTFHTAMVDEYRSLKALLDKLHILRTLDYSFYYEMGEKGNDHFHGWVRYDLTQLRQKRWIKSFLGVWAHWHGFVKVKPVKDFDKWYTYITKDIQENEYPPVTSVNHTDYAERFFTANRVDKNALQKFFNID